MILSPISSRDLPDLLARFDDCLAGEDLARTVFGRIARTLDLVPLDLVPPDLVKGGDLSLSEDPRYRAQAIELCHRFGMDIIDGPPSDGFTWDGRAVRVGCEPSVIIHEVGHLQCASPDRRGVYDFGLGAGPETGRRQEADAAAGVFGVERDREEALASLLGILWEAELNQPAILAFLEQNWLEGGERPENKAHFLKNLRILEHHGLIDRIGRPTRSRREERSAERFYGIGGG